MISYIVRMKGGEASVSAPSTPSIEEAPAPAPAPQVEAQSTPMVSDAGIESSLIEVVVKHTGYPADFIEMDQDLEGELGIDTVKQAEIMVDVKSFLYRSMKTSCFPIILH